MKSTAPVVSVLLPRYQNSRAGDAFEVVEIGCYEQRVFHYLGMAPPEASDLPTANCHHFFDYGEVVAAGTVAVEPIHIAMDSDHGRLIPRQQLQLELVDCEALCESINDFLVDDGLRMEFSSPIRWYLHGCDPSDVDALDTRPAHLLAGRNLGPFMPRRANAKFWRQLFTEIQMALHTHPVNTRRQQHHLPPVNGFWMWGGARMQLSPVFTKSSIPPLVFTDDPFTVGLCRAASVPVVSLSEFDAGELNAEHILVLDTSAYEAGLRGSDIAADFEIGRQEVMLLKPLRAKLKHRALSELRVEVGETPVEVSGPEMRWWRRFGRRG